MGEGYPIMSSSAIVVLIKERKLYCGNVGTSHAVASIGGQLKGLSMRHDPTEGKPYIYRTLGLFEEKLVPKNPMDEIWTAYPDVDTFQLDENWEFVILASFSVWEPMGQMNVFQYCRHRIGQGEKPQQICENLIKYCPDRRSRGDKIIILICLLNGKPYSNLVARCQTPVEGNDDLVER